MLDFTHECLQRDRNALTYEQAMKACEGHHEAYRMLLEHQPKNGHGGDRRSARAKQNQEYAHTLDRTGARKEALASRLLEKHPRIYDAFQRGQYKSIREAAEAAGLVKPGHDPLKRLKSYWKKATPKQRKDFLAWIATMDD